VIYQFENDYQIYKGVEIMKKNLIKKFTALLLAGLMAFSFTGCAGSKKTKENSNTSSASSSVTNADRKIKVVCTTYPQYDWVRQIIGDRKDDYELTLLLDNGVDLHSYQPTADDIIKVSDCDMFIYVGGESDEWVEDALANKTNKDMVVINLLDVLGDSVKEEELVEGMEGEEEEEEGEEEEGPEYDEHVWLSVKSSSIICSKIAEELEKADPDNKSIYEANAKEYIAKLDELDNKYQEVVSGAKYDTVLFGDRFQFRYLVDDYNLDYFAAFVGCSAESEASFETITFLADKVDELGLKSILQIETSDGKIANTIKDNTKSKDQKILTMDSMQSVTADELQSGVTYISVMESNLEVLKSALN
jgi:zinc transport system substrate-binding protein